jgi:hypothetical protein
MQHDKSLFTDYHRLKHRLFVGGIGSGVMAIGIGKVSITDPNGNVRVLENVLHIPKLKCGLMSLDILTLQGWTSTISKNGCTVSDGKFSIHSQIKNGLHMCVESDSRFLHTGPNALFAGVPISKKHSLRDWHEHLGHVSTDTLLKFGESAIEDLDLGLVDSKPIDQELGKPCIHGKHHRSLPVSRQTMWGPSRARALRSLRIERHFHRRGEACSHIH